MCINCLAERQKCHGDGEIRTRALSMRVEVQALGASPWQGFKGQSLPLKLLSSSEMLSVHLTLIPLGYFEDLSPLGGGGGCFAPPPLRSRQLMGPIDSKIGTVVKQVK